MVNTILALSGEVGAGKTTLAKRLVARYQAHHISTHVLLSRRLGSDGVEARGALQEAGQRLDQQTHGAWILDEMAPELDLLPPDALVVVDAIRIRGQLDALRNRYGRRVTHLHLKAPLSELQKRYAGRVRNPKFREFRSYDKVRENRTERNVRRLSDDADIVIDTASCTEADVEVRAAAHLGLSGRSSSPLVDVVVGGQYGSEGKGNVAFYLARDYDLLVRVGGPNAGHMVPRQTVSLSPIGSFHLGRRTRELHF